MKLYLLRVSIALDQLLQAASHWGKPGITISARAGTAEAHQHAWGIYLSRILSRVLGANHCKDAIRNDRLRAHAVLKELSDPAVVTYLRRK